MIIVTFSSVWMKRALFAQNQKKLILTNVFIYVEMGDIKAEDGEDAEDDWYWFQT